MPPSRLPRSALLEFSSVNPSGARNVKPKRRVEEAATTHHALGGIVTEHHAVDRREIGAGIGLADAKPDLAGGSGRLGDALGRRRMRR